MRLIVFLLLQAATLLGGSWIFYKIDGGRATPRFFWAVVVIVGSALAIALFHFAPPLIVFQDFVPVYWEAGRAVLSSPAELLPLLTLGVEGGFVNLPIVAYLFAPFALLPAYTAGWLFLVLGVIAVLIAWRLACTAYSLNRVESAVALLILCGFGPLAYSFREGNSSHLLLLTLLVMVMAVRKERDFLAGMLLGVSAILKPPLLLLGVYALFRARWRFSFGAGIVVAITVLASLWVFGLDMHRVWYDTNLGTFARDPIGALNAHSIASVVSRLYHGLDVIMLWAPAPIPDYLRMLVLALTGLLALIAFAAAAPWRRWLVGPAEFEADLMLIIVFILLVSTLTWLHYYCWILLPLAWLWVRIRDGAVATRVLWALAVIICSQPFLRWPAPSAFVLELLPIIFAYLCVGGLLVFGLLVWFRAKMAYGTFVPSPTSGS